jgi:acyl-CoA carboxylase subunit beta
MTAKAATSAGAVSFVEEWDTDLASTNPLRFPGYRVPAAEQESVRTGLALVGSTKVGVVDCQFARLGGSMGAVAGERVVRVFARATDRRLPVVALVASGGARLQEGMVSLVQMARTASAVRDHSRAGLLFAAVYRPHTTGGVLASWASLADVRAAEPGAIVGFAGPRIVAQVTGEMPPTTSHAAESAYACGLVDALVPPQDQLSWLAGVLTGNAPPLALPAARPARPDISPLPDDPWLMLARARSAIRPSGVEWAAWLTDSWVELRGPDPSIRAGLATIANRRVVVVASDRHAIGDAAARPGPAAFRLAQRAMNLAGRLGLPVVTLIDLPGAEPGPAAEADGIASEIARTLFVMADLPVPTVALCVGEGGSGGAMALAHADRFYVLDGAVFSVIGPEAGAAMLYRDTSRAPELARALGITASDLLALGIADRVLPETGADAVDRVREKVARALADARVGDRTTRPATATRRALVEHATAWSAIC